MLLARIHKEIQIVSQTSRNTPQDVCRVIAMAMLADNNMDDQEIAVLAEMKVHEKAGINPDEFRGAIHELCKEAMFNEDGTPNVSVTELGLITEILPLLNREGSMDMESVSHLVELVNRADPTLLGESLLDGERLDATLDRIDDRRLQLWIGSMLVRMVHADGEVHDNEKVLVSHVLNRWSIAPESLGVAN
jgi:uncharacterized tellurite resistance protein B-like protein